MASLSRVSRTIPGDAIASERLKAAPPLLDGHPQLEASRRGGDSISVGELTFGANDIGPDMPMLFVQYFQTGPYDELTSIMEVVAVCVSRLHYSDARAEACQMDFAKHWAVYGGAWDSTVPSTSCITSICSPAS